MKHIAIVDDEPQIREILTKVFLKEGFDVDAFESAEMFLKSFTRVYYDLLICDINMPTMSGLELIERIRLSCDRKLPIVIYSANEEQSVIQKAHTLSISRYIPKPASLKVLVSSVNESLS